jgi:hypothetical protein
MYFYSSIKLLSKCRECLTRHFLYQVATAERGKRFFMSNQDKIKCVTRRNVKAISIQNFPLLLNDFQLLPANAGR